MLTQYVPHMIMFMQRILLDASLSDMNIRVSLGLVGCAMAGGVVFVHNLTAGGSDLATIFGAQMTSVIDPTFARKLLAEGMALVCRGPFPFPSFSPTILFTHDRDRPKLGPEGHPRQRQVG